MNGIIKNVGSVLTRAGSKMLFKAKKMSPELLLVGGGLLIIAGTVTACMKTKDAREAVSEAQNKADNLKEQHEEMTISDHEYTIEKRKITVHMVGGIMKAYAIPIALEMTGLAMIFASHGIMKKRSAALLAAYNTLDAAFQQYRDRVRQEENGTDLDHKFMFGDDYPREADDGLNQDSITDINKEGLKLASSNPFGPYGFEFSKFTTNKWSPRSLDNLATIRGAEEWANRKLKWNGHVFLNEVLEYIGLDAVPWGQLVGWIRGNQDADGVISILALEDQERLEMDNDGWKKPIFLDFNCDGVIWDKI